MAKKRSKQSLDAIIERVLDVPDDWRIPAKRFEVVNGEFRPIAEPREWITRETLERYLQIPWVAQQFTKDLDKHVPPEDLLRDELVILALEHGQFKGCESLVNTFAVNLADAYVLLAFDDLSALFAHRAQYLLTENSERIWNEICRLMPTSYPRIASLAEMLSAHECEDYKFSDPQKAAILVDLLLYSKHFRKYACTVRPHTPENSVIEKLTALAVDYFRRAKHEDSAKPKTPFEDRLAQAGGVKREVYINDAITLRKAEALGVNTAPYRNLCDASVVADAVHALQTHQKLKRSGAYQRINAAILERVGVSVANLGESDIEIYADEIAESLVDGCAGKIPKELRSLAEHADGAFKRTADSPVSFRYAGRNTSDKRLGDLCGDCTQKDGINEDKVDGWIADSMTQFLKIYYEGKFIGRFNLVLVEEESGGNQTQPLLLVDAIEFIPQARNVNKYTTHAKRAFSEAIEQVKFIAHAMDVPSVAAYTFSNSRGVEKELGRLGYSETDLYSFKPIRGRPLHEVVDVTREIKYFFQTKEQGEVGVNEGQLRILETFINREYTRFGEDVEGFRAAVAEERFDKAADLLGEHEPVSGGPSMIERVFKGNTYDIEAGLRHLYSTDTGELKQGVELTKIL